MAKDKFAFRYHGTSMTKAKKIMEEGLKATPDPMDGENRAYVTPSLKHAKGYARHYGPDGAVVKLKVPAKMIEEHPDSDFKDIHWANEDIPAKYVKSATSNPGSRTLRNSTEKSQEMYARIRGRKLT